MKRFSLLLLFIAIFTFTYSQADSQWIRYSAISPDGSQIAFTFKGDIYLVNTGGGQTRPLTFHKAHDFKPVWSPDGETLAFASNRFGNFDVYSIPAKGGEAQRLTFHSNDEFCYWFTHDGEKVIFGGHRMDDVKHRQYPTSGQTEVYLVPLNRERIEQLWTIPGEDICVSNDGETIIYHDKPGGENPFRKHHQSAVCRNIWMWDKISGTHKILTKFKGEDRNPVFSPDEQGLYYLSEESGTFNVHKMDLDNPANNTQISNFDFHPVRYLSISIDGKLCYTWHGNLYTQQEGEEPIKLDVEILTEGKSNNELILPITGNVSEMAVSPNGKEVAYIVRGEIFVSSVEGKMTRRITETPAQESFVSFSPDGKTLLYASERNTKWSIYKTNKVNDAEPYFYAATLLKEEAVIENEHDNYQPKFSPDGKEITYIENKVFLNVFNLKTKQSRTLLTGDELYYMSDGGQYFTWSPDSKWLLVEYTPVLANVEIVLLAADGSQEMINLTENGYNDFSPKWVNGGKQILWFSDRQGLHAMAHSGSRQTDVYSMFLTQQSWDQFNLTKDEYALWKEMNKKPEIEKSDKKKKDKKKKNDEETKDSTEVKIDWRNLDERVKRLTIHSSALKDAVLSKDGETLYYLAVFEKDMNLWSSNLRTKETAMLVKLSGKSGSLTWDKKMENLFLLSEGKIAKIDLKEKKTKPIKIEGEMVLDVAAERKLMFDHVWKRNLTMFYISDYHGALWDQLKDEYEPKLESISNDFEFTELLSEMLGELNVSHSGARYRPKNPLGDKTASLGIFYDFNYDGDGLKITEVIKGGPFDKGHLTIKPGMIITKIDGTELSKDFDYAKLLNRKANEFLSVYIENPEADTAANITIKPISPDQERSLLYKRWVKMNEEEVDSLSKGTIGYVHIPGMGDGPYRNTYGNVMGKYHDCDGIIVDTRNNGGGDLVSDLAMFLSGEKFLDYAIESRSLGYEPGWRWTKPSLVMVNESNYSDGHCFACGYQELGIGNLVGMPVPGTCSWAGWEMLQNGTVVWGSIPLSAKNSKGEWLENNQTEPEIKVKNMPGIIGNGRDQQLEAAVEDMLKTLKED